ncbi:hypothetical protein COV24_01490 [candidate division WWE3 bacterium CG10_big_fil_rev_8_21_14_0_10_32_10]|uniref:Uncharacterized protein n=1 Tax=candidate division WWE3 bacterium CG10_big_fil_rev_8_21_14_0_10_32_10 TaxID=1975090 RepID=A0A2H0RB70_UNCKA|nr:MAG: hypothetical protein COV24_01490 [candidate division WWE3 bacterium CG10_big_fil_rev_8_21_14_0_10_32_10]
MVLKNNKKNYKALKKKFDRYHSKALVSLHKSHSSAMNLAKTNALALIGGAMLMSGVAGNHVPANAKSSAISSISENSSKKDSQDFDKMQNLLLTNPNALTTFQEEDIQNTLSENFNINLKVTRDGNRLNEIWGYFGQEQHLYRWGGDTLNAHIGGLDHGIAPSTGAFGYFDNATQEQYYIAAPIHLLPNWNTDWPTLKPWYKFRKVLVYNPKNQKAVVAVIGDAGPAAWTEKQFGGSPELMEYLDMYDGSAKSRAVVLFLDKDNQNIKLGPIKKVGSVVSSII